MLLFLTTITFFTNEAKTVSNWNPTVEAGMYLNKDIITISMKVIMSKQAFENHSVLCAD